MEVYDFIGVGAGPANLSLAIQAIEASAEPRHRFLLLEKEKEVGWHQGMLLPGSRMDTHFVKDLISMVNPTSEFTFLNFLHTHNRLADFLNCGNPCAFREDFDEYLRWAAQKLSPVLMTGCQVVDLARDENGSFDVLAEMKNGRKIELKARNLVLGAGGRPKYICGLNANSKRVIHSAEFMKRVHELPARDKGCRILVIGAGQSAGEIAHFLLLNSECEVHLSLSDYALQSKEGTAFINESYNGDFVDRFFSFKADMKSWFNTKRKNMNYGVIDGSLIAAFYNDLYYNQKFKNRGIAFRSFTRVKDVDASTECVKVELFNQETDETLKEIFDFVILATGYKPTFGLKQLQHLVNHTGSKGQNIKVNRDFSVGEQLSHTENNVFLNSNVSASHGPAEDVLSVISHRARDILSSIQTHVCHQVFADFKNTEPTKQIASSNSQGGRV